MHAAVLAIVCLIPAAFTWFSGRSLLAMIDDPVLPERLVAHRRRNRGVQMIVLWSVVTYSVVVASVGSLLWAMPLTVMARTVAAFRLRRALYDERWSVAGYLAWNVRFLLAFVGFRLLLIATPAIASAAGSYDWAAALGLGVVLLLWNNRSAEVVRALMRPKPLADSDLLTRFEMVAAKSTTPHPRFEVVELHGGSIANALALASRRGSSVVYTDTVLRLLDAEEAVAITGHEIAHLEYYDAARLRRLNAIMIALIAGATASALLPRFVPLVSSFLLGAVWAAMCVVVLAWLMRDRQRNETSSDRRAVELCGDPEALIRALTKVYTFARVPRRFDTQTEHTASHPSLARRIRSIRDAAGTAPAPPQPPQPESVRGRDGGASVTFEPDRLRWQESEGAIHVLSYSHLTELRVAATTARGTRLVAVERGGRRWEIPLDQAEGARAQVILDSVDGRLAEPPPRKHSPLLLKAAGVAVAICGMWVGQVVVALVALFAAVRSVAALFAAAGGAALGAAGVVGRQAISTGDVSSAWPAVPLAVFGTALLAGAWDRRNDEGNRVVNLGTAGLVLLTASTVALVVLRGGDAVRLYQASLALPSAAILPFALAAVLACKPRRAWRLAAIPIALVGVIVAIIGSGTFLHAFGRDPFLSNDRLLPMRTMGGKPTVEFTLPRGVSELRLSPHARRIAVRRYPTAPAVVAQYEAGAFAVGTPGAELAPVDAHDLVFLDDERALTLTIEGTRVRLREIVLSTRAVAWEQAIDNLVAPRIAYQRRTNRWIVIGLGGDGGVVSVEGTPGRDRQRRRAWSTGGRPEVVGAFAIRDDSLLIAQTTLDIESLTSGPWLMTFAALLNQMETRLTRITPDGATAVIASRLEANCSDPALDGERLVCLAFDGARTHVLAIDAAGGDPEPLGALAGHFTARQPTAGGWLVGWIETGGLADFRQAAIDVTRGRVFAIPSSLGADQVTIAGGVAAALRHDAVGTHVRFYSVDE